MDLENFVEQNLVIELEEVRKHQYGSNTSILDDFEKTLIYNYTFDGFEELNETLRTGGTNDYEDLLNTTLDKLYDYQGLVYRGVELEDSEIQVYQEALDNDVPVTELSFVSTSKLRYLCFPYSGFSTLFRIMSKTGKEIEDISFYGTNSISDQNEQEVLFKSKTQFRVLEISEVDSKTFIDLEEF